MNHTKLGDMVYLLLRNGLLQRGGTILVGENQVVQAIRLALIDIATYVANGWSWQYTAEVISAPAEGINTFETQHNIFNVLSMSEVTMNNTGLMPSTRNTCPDIRFVQTPHLKTTNDVFYTPGSGSITLDHSKHGHTLYYYKEIGLILPDVQYDEPPANRRPTIDLQQLLPTPTVFDPALYHLALFYLYPGYGQLGENKESNAYTVGTQKLEKLKAVFAPQINSL